jgi:hypothetical protein
MPENETLQHRDLRKSWQEVFFGVERVAVKRGEFGVDQSG